MQTQTFMLYIDDVPLEFVTPQVTGKEVMAKAASDQLVVLLEDGTQRQVGANEIFDLEHAHRFKRPPHFKRG